MFDAGWFYALLRFEEASLTLRSALHHGLIDRLDGRPCSLDSLQADFGFTHQGARTLVNLLVSMRILQPADTHWALTGLAKDCLSSDSAASRAPYLSMGSGEAEAELWANLRGEFSAPPLYASSGSSSLMEDEDTQDLAEAIGFGLASRAKAFAPNLARVIRDEADETQQHITDLGAGSPHVLQNCLAVMPHLSRATLADQAAGLKFAKMMAGEHDQRLEFVEVDIFQTIPDSDLFVISNTAHDWLLEDYKNLVAGMANAISPGGLVIVHEPLLVAEPDEERQLEALWMACYALTLFRLTVGQGSCYSVDEHDDVFRPFGFARSSEPTPTMDGCSTLIYRQGTT
ncbi:MAG: methyltransferase [Planctomycetota bacterium]